MAADKSESVLEAFEDAVGTPTDGTPADIGGGLGTLTGGDGGPGLGTPADGGGGLGTPAAGGNGGPWLGTPAGGDGELGTPTAGDDGLGTPTAGGGELGTPTGGGPPARDSSPTLRRTPNGSGHACCPTEAGATSPGNHTTDAMFSSAEIASPDTRTDPVEVADDSAAQRPAALERSGSFVNRVRNFGKKAAAESGNKLRLLKQKIHEQLVPTVKTHDSALETRLKELHSTQATYADLAASCKEVFVASHALTAANDKMATVLQLLSEKELRAENQLRVSAEMEAILARNGRGLHESLDYFRDQMAGVQATFVAIAPAARAYEAARLEYDAVRVRVGDSTTDPHFAAAQDRFDKAHDALIGLLDDCDAKRSEHVSRQLLGYQNSVAMCVVANQVGVQQVLGQLTSVESDDSDIETPPDSATSNTVITF